MDETAWKEFLERYHVRHITLRGHLKTQRLDDHLRENSISEGCSDG